MFADSLSMSLTDAIFESMSGLTTTGATVLTGLDELPRAILYYRQQLQWLGGMGIIVLAVAVLPMLGIGGMQLYRAETPGPVKDTKLTPRITETAKALWYVYLAFTIACAAFYMLAGMNWFDALCHSFSTVAIGGFSTHDLNMGYFDSTAIDLVAIVFMFAAGINFSLHFFAWRYVSVKHYSQDPEFRAYFAILVAVSVLVIAWLFQHQVFDSPGAYFAIIGANFSNLLPSPSRLIELIIGLPGICFIVASITSGSVESITSGASISKLNLFTRFNINSRSSERSVVATQTSRQ